MKFWGAILEHFGFLFGTILEPTGAQNEVQNASKMTPKVSLIFVMIFASF